MCCFSQAVEYVSNTNIFARPLPEGRQALVYSMSFAAAGELAMILPLPVPPGPPEDAVRFVSLEGYDDFFTDMKKAFPVMMAPQSRGGIADLGMPEAGALVVHDVGDFEASFVPTMKDFERLDERFKLSTDVWDRLPQYADWGFAVFKLKGGDEPGFFDRLRGRTGSAKKDVHPMAFEFPRRDPDALFFPTVHIHDGEVHDQAAFDHTLYCQADAMPEATGAPDSWEKSAGPLGQHVDSKRSKDLIDPDAFCYRRVLLGMMDNRDQELRSAEG
ncbi:MAG: hypothetical protein DRJ42_30555 [Deltaproteobacteria bacterium]|nr:MAG: hypothetical protein DRJ42_30555 [Deltaproteobacteria bacterium]